MLFIFLIVNLFSSEIVILCAITIIFSITASNETAIDGMGMMLLVTCDVTVVLLLARCEILISGYSSNNVVT